MNINLVSTFITYLFQILLFLTSFPPAFPAANLSTVPMGGTKHSTNKNIEHITDTHAMKKEKATSALSTKENPKQRS